MLVLSGSISLRRFLFKGFEMLPEVNINSFSEREITQRGIAMVKIIHFLKAEDGVTSIEYALIAGFIFLAIVSVITMLGGSVYQLHHSVSESFNK